MVRPEVYASLVHSHQFKTIRQHADSIIEANPGMAGQQADIEQVLQSMLDNGIMVSAKYTCERLKSGADPADTRTDAPVVTIITWERVTAGRTGAPAYIDCRELRYRKTPSTLCYRRLGQR
jgi:hypothetical protein